VTTTLAALVTIAVLAAAGALPVRMLAGWRPVTPFIAPIGGAVLAGAAGELTVLADGTELGWFVPLAIAANAAATASWLARREARRSRTVFRPSLWLWTVGGAGLLGVAGAAAWSLRSVASQAIGRQALGIWLVHAGWIQSGHKVALAALTDRAFVAAHSTYPPLGPASVALGWTISGLTTDRVGLMVLVILTGCAVAAAGTTAIEVGFVASARSSVGRAKVSRGFVMVVAGAAGVAWVFGAYGFAGASATNGALDLLWSTAAIAAAGLGLVLPPGGERARAAAVLALAAGMTSDEGAVAAVAVFALMAFRWLNASRRRYRSLPGRISHSRAIVATIACAFGTGGVLVWPIGVAVRRATPNDELTGARAGSILNRADNTWHSMIAQLHVAGLALLIGIVAQIVLGRARRSLGLGSDQWVWILGVVEVLAVAAAYVIGTKPAQSWLASSVDRTTLFANCIGLSILAWWCVTGAAVAFAPGRDPDSDDGTDAAGPPSVTPGQLADSRLVDGNGPAVLHPGS
jgi:hypothetical protein